MCVRATSRYTSHPGSGGGHRVCTRARREQGVRRQYQNAPKARGFAPTLAPELTFDAQREESSAACVCLLLQGRRTFVSRGNVITRVHLSPSSRSRREFSRRSRRHVQISSRGRRVSSPITFIVSLRRLVFHVTVVTHVLTICCPFFLLSHSAFEIEFEKYG